VLALSSYSGGLGLNLCLEAGHSDDRCVSVFLVS
jgi:hypothetical protein